MYTISASHLRTDLGTFQFYLLLSARQSLYVTNFIECNSVISYESNYSDPNCLFTHTQLLTDPLQPVKVLLE